jgi:hypothetical protein
METAGHPEGDHATLSRENQEAKQLPASQDGGLPKAEEEWLTTGSEYVGIRVARYVKEDGKRYAEEGVVTGWLPIELADFVSETTGEVGTKSIS